MRRPRQSGASSSSSSMPTSRPSPLALATAAAATAALCLGGNVASAYHVGGFSRSSVGPTSAAQVSRWAFSGSSLGGRSSSGGSGSSSGSSGSARRRSSGSGSGSALYAMGSLSPSSSSPADDEPEGTRVEEAFRMTTREIRALQRLLDGFSEAPAPNDPPQFPPAEVSLPAPTRDTVERDRAEVLRLNARYYECLNDRDVKGLLALWRQDEDGGATGQEVQLYANEDSVVVGRAEIDKHYDSRFRAAWASNKHKTRLDAVAVEDERVFLRGINAFVTNKEVWENPRTKERKVLFATKVMTKSNGEWSVVHVHTGDGSQVEVNSNGQMKLTDALRGLGQGQQAAGGRVAGQQQQPGQLGSGAASLGGLLGSGGALGGGVGGEGASGFTADGREFRTIVTPEGYRIILGSNGVGGIQGSLGGGAGAAGGQPRSGQETKEALLKALIQDLSKNGKGGDMIPLQLGAGGRSSSSSGGGGGGQLFSSSSSGRRSGNNNGNGGGADGADGLTLTKKTVGAIRQLCADGRITLEQKQRLIFSIIRSTKREEVSQVEMAYELLVENALAGEEHSMEEFGDQCLIILEGLDEMGRDLDDDDDDEDDDDDDIYGPDPRRR